MGEDRSLEEFAQPRGENSEQERDPTQSGTEATGTEDEGSAPIDITSRVDPETAPCAECGDTVQRRWRTDAGYCCVDCVLWTESDEDEEAG
ncbi:MAG: hypothetical protein ABEJ35_01750 [Halobacteriaceae archaeon]